MTTKLLLLSFAAIAIVGCGQMDAKDHDATLREVCSSLEVECLQLEAMFRWMNKMGEMSGFYDSPSQNGKETVRSLVVESRKRVSLKLATLKSLPADKRQAVDLASQLFLANEVAGNSMDFKGPATDDRKSAATVAMKEMRSAKTALSQAAPPGCITP
jgi:hypothetical protein